MATVKLVAIVCRHRWVCAGCINDKTTCVLIQAISSVPLFARNQLVMLIGMAMLHEDGGSNLFVHPFFFSKVWENMQMRGEGDSFRSESLLVTNDMK